jgi:hypothetical protein
MRFGNHSRLNAIVTDRRCRVREREDGIVEIIERRLPPGVGECPVNAGAPRRRTWWRSARPPARKPWWPSIGSALLSVPAQIFVLFAEGFALYAVAMNPGLFCGSSQNSDREGPTDDVAERPRFAAGVNSNGLPRSRPDPAPHIEESNF